MYNNLFATTVHKPRKPWLSILLLGGILIFSAGCIQQAPTNQENAINATSTISPGGTSNVNQTFTVTLRIEEQSFTTEVQIGVTALVLLERIATQNNIPLTIEQTALGPLITKIGEKTNGSNGKYWVYTVNGEFAPVGAADYVLVPDDTIAFTFQ